MKKKLLLLSVLFALFCLCTLDGVYVWRNAPMIYEGRVEFGTQEEFGTFLDFVTQEEVEIKDLLFVDSRGVEFGGRYVIESNIYLALPISAEFLVATPKDMAFPFGGVGEQQKGVWEWLFGFAIPGIVFLSVGTVAWGLIYRIT